MPTYSYFNDNKSEYDKQINDITVNGKVVATGAQITARFTKGAGYTHIEGNVYSRAATTYEYYNTRSALVYMYNARSSSLLN